MVKKGKQKAKKDKIEQNFNKKKKDKRHKIEKKNKKENTKKKEDDKNEEIKEKEEDKKGEIIEKINKVKYLMVYVGNEDCDDGVETYRENGEEVGRDEEEPPLNYGNFGFTVDVDTGRILDWPDTKLYVKVHMRAIDTGFYTFCDKDNNKIYEIDGYVPDFLGITSPGYGDNINFDTDVNGFILDWKEKEIKKQIIKYLKYWLGEEEDD